MAKEITYYVLVVVLQLLMSIQPTLAGERRMFIIVSVDTDTIFNKKKQERKCPPKLTSKYTSFVRQCGLYYYEDHVSVIIPAYTSQFWVKPTGNERFTNILNVLNTAHWFYANSGTFANSVCRTALFACGCTSPGRNQQLKFLPHPFKCCEAYSDSLIDLITSFFFHQAMVIYRPSYILEPDRFSRSNSRLKYCLYNCTY